MSSPDGWTEGEGDLPFLPKDGVQRFWEDLLRPGEMKPVSWSDVEDLAAKLRGELDAAPHHVICCVCRGEGWVRAVTEYVNPNLGTRTTGTLTTSCLACDGSGSVGMVRERKGTA